jgi:hypothetical protein
MEMCIGGRQRQVTL